LHFELHEAKAAIPNTGIEKGAATLSRRATLVLPEQS